MKMRTKLRLASFLLSMVVADAALAVTCSTVPLNIQPQWISTLEFNPSGDEILIADPKSKELLSFRIASNEVAKLQLDIAPASITKISNGFMVQSSREAEVVGPLKKKVAKISLEQARGDLKTLYSNWITRGSTFVGFGVVALRNTDLSRLEFDPARGFQLGFIRGKVSDSGEFQKIDLLESTEDNDAYLLGLPYFAANDLGIFFVHVAEGEASIYEVREQGTPALVKLPVFPAEFRAIPPQFAKNQVGPATTKERFSLLEKSRMVVGLFGHGSFLYLLAREPNRSGPGTQWLLYQIHPRETKPRGAVRLPTTTNHLSVAVGSNDWYFFERGEVRDWGNQDIKSVVRVPTSWITAPLSSLLNATNPRIMECPLARQGGVK